VIIRFWSEPISLCLQPSSPFHRPGFCQCTFLKTRPQRPSLRRQAAKGWHTHYVGSSLAELNLPILFPVGSSHESPGCGRSGRSGSRQCWVTQADPFATRWKIRPSGTSILPRSSRTPAGGSKVCWQSALQNMVPLADVDPSNWGRASTSVQKSRSLRPVGLIGPAPCWERSHDPTWSVNRAGHAMTKSLNPGRSKPGPDQTRTKTIGR